MKKTEQTSAAGGASDGRLHLMALNAFRGGNKGSVCSLPLSEYDKTIRYPWIHEMVLQIRGEKSIRSVDNAEGKALAKAQQRIKGQLPFRCAHYSHFVDNKRRQDHIDPESFLFQTTIDVDDKEYVDEAIAKAKYLDTADYLTEKAGEEKAGEEKAASGEKANPWRGMLLHLEYSARKKLHIDIRMPVGMTIEETQRAYCEALGVPYDESCISPERIIFVTDKESEIYRSPHWYEVLPDEELAQRRQAFLDRGLSIDGRGKAGSSFLPPASSSSSSVNTKHYTLNTTQQHVKDHRLSGSDSDNAVLAGAAVQPAQPSNSHPSDAARLSPAGAYPNAGGVGLSASSPTQQSAGEPQAASEKNLVAFDLFRQQAGLGSVSIDSEGSRHSSLLAIMSAGASRVMSEGELKKVVAQKMPSFAEENDCQQLIHDFYAKYTDSSKPMSQAVMRINATAERMASKLEMTNEKLDISNGSQAAQPFLIDTNSSFLIDKNSSFLINEEDYPAPPEMPKRLPGLVELLVSKTPDIYKPAVAHAIFPSLAAHLWRTTFRYIDNVEHEATLMCCLLAGTGAGKNCVQKPIDYIMADIRQRDQDNLRREKEWKEEMTRKGANKDKRKRPQDLVIQEIDADMTNPAFVMRTAEAKEHFLYTSLNEINQFDALRGQGNQQFVIMCLAFDPGNQYGQTRVGTQSVTERVTIRFNWNASTTIKKGQRYFARVLTDGPLSRINFCTIPEREIGAEMPVYGTYDEAFRQALQPYIDNLCRASGLVDCPEAFQLAMRLKDENAEFARVSQNRIFENLSFRGNVIAYLKACVLYVANGYRWEPEMEDFIRWSEQYDLYCKMRFFGDAIAKAEEEGVKSSKRGPKNLLQDLPDEFSIGQAQEIRLRNGLDASATRSMVNNWVSRGYVKRKEAPTGGNINISNISFVKLRYRKDGAESN